MNLADNSRASTAVGLLSLVILLPGAVGCGTVVTQDLEKFQKAGPVRFEVDVAALVQAKTPVGPYRVVPGDLLSIRLPVLDPLSNSLTDGSSGVRALRVAIFKDPRFLIDQNWLNRYELEPYLYYKTVRLGYKVKEVPIEVIYPKKNYTKMRVFIDWWKITRPLIFLKLGIKS